MEALVKDGTKPKPRRRRFTPKVRSGCITWIRRKKCDEEKPTCRRCRDEKYKCEGYAASIPPRAKAQAGSASNVDRSVAGSRLAPRAVMDVAPLSPGPVVSNNQNPSEDLLLHHFFNSTLSEINALPRVERFWSHRLPLLAREVPSIRHSILAVSAGHKAFLASGSASTEMESVLLTQYNKAISHLEPLLASSSAVDVGHVLVCCLFFISVESLRGRYDEALRHLESGANIILSHATTPLEQSDGLMWDLAMMFATLSGDMAAFADEKLLPDISCCVKTSPAEGSSHGPFQSIAEARDALVDLELVIARIEWDDWDLSECQSSPGSVDKQEEVHEDWKKLQSMYQQWQSKLSQSFEPLQREANANPQGRARYQRLELEQLCWQLTLESRSEDDYAADYYPKLPDLIEKVFSSDRQAKFSYRTDMITHVIFAYSCSTQESARERLIAMLRSQPQRRELVWDSRAVADFLERDLEGRRKGTIDQKTWPAVGPSRDQGALLTMRPRIARTEGLGE